MSELKEELQKLMAEIFEKQFNDASELIDRAYARGFADGRTSAKKEIIDMIKWEETK
jgi:hypothetical protein